MVLLRQTGVLFATLLGAVALLAALAPGTSWSQSSESPAEHRVDSDPEGLPYAAGELLVSYKPEAEAETQDETERRSGGRVEKDLPEVRARLLSVPEVKDEPSSEVREEMLESVKQALEQDPEVEAVEYNYLREAQYTPDDPSFGEQYGLKRPGFPKAWERARGAGVTIAVVDTGIDASHPDLAGKIVGQYDFVDEDGLAEDESGHGTHVAGIAAAVTDNGQGVAGGCPDCQLLVAKVLNAQGLGTLADEVEGITWAADQGAKVINLSLGAPSSSAAEEAAVDYAWGKGAVVVAAAGNQRTNGSFYPAAYPKALAVAATGPNDRRASSFSNYGKYVDVAAPGTGILSTVPGGGYGEQTGTSMASPHAAALAALLAEGGLSNQEIRPRMKKTAEDLGPEGRDKYYGAGRISAARAVG